MGFFSFKTQDTGRSISNSHSDWGTFPVYMRDNKGNQWVEHNYDGYGEFGGKDIYELLAEMNGLTGREAGITLFFSGKAEILYPSLTEFEQPGWKNELLEDCEFQGFFYPNDEDDEDDWDEDDDYTEDEEF